nr:DUF6731 family protein [Halobacteroides halobius]
MIKEFGKYEAINAEVAVTMGYTRGEGLNSETVYDTLEEIKKNEHMVKKAKFHIKETEDTKVEKIDLFQDKIRDKIHMDLEEKEGVDCYELASLMYSKFQESIAEIMESLEKN